jgi:hypothetical protein
MKSIQIKNEHGETIEIKRDSDGKIKLRHSDWGDEFGEYLDAEIRMNESSGLPLAHSAIVFGRLCSLNREETQNIKSAIKQL